VVNILYQHGTQKNGTPNGLIWRWNIAAQEDVLNFCSLLQPEMGQRRAAKMAECLSDLYVME